MSDVSALNTKIHIMYSLALTSAKIASSEDKEKYIRALEELSTTLPEDQAKYVKSVILEIKTA